MKMIGMHVATICLIHVRYLIFLICLIHVRYLIFLIVLEQYQCVELTLLETTNKHQTVLMTDTLIRFK